MSVALRTLYKVKDWRLLYRIHQGQLTGGLHLIRLRDGTRFKIRGDVGDGGVLREVVVQDYYHLDAIMRTDTVLDIGGGFGDFAVLAVECCRTRLYV